MVSCHVQTVTVLLFPFHLACFQQCFIVTVYIFFFINLFNYLWLRWVFIAVRRLSLVVVSGGSSSLQCTGFSLQWLLLLRSMGSRYTGFNSCGPRTQLLCSMWDLPGPGLEPVSPALAGGFLTTAPPGKSSHCVYCPYHILPTQCCQGEAAMPQIASLQLLGFWTHNLNPCHCGEFSLDFTEP